MQAITNFLGLELLSSIMILKFIMKKLLKVK